MKHLHLCSQRGVHDPRLDPTRTAGYIVMKHERSNSELNAIFVQRGMHNKLSNVFILRKLRATLCTDRGGWRERAISSRGRLQSDYYACINVPLSLARPLLRVSTYSPARNTIDKSGASGISKRMQFKKEQ